MTFRSASRTSNLEVKVYSMGGDLVRDKEHVWNKREDGFK